MATAPPIHTENGAVARMTNARPRTPISSGVSRVTGRPRLSATADQRTQGEDRGDFRQVQHAQRGDQVLRPEEEQRRERHQPDEGPVTRFALSRPGGTGAARGRLFEGVAALGCFALMPRRPVAEDQPFHGYFHTFRPRRSANSPASAE